MFVVNGVDWGLQDQITTVVTDRMREDQLIQHHKNKAEAEREKLKTAEEAAKDVEAEFEVCVCVRS